MTIPHLLELFDHPIRLGYEIVCLFSTTLMKSMVGVSAQHHGLHMVVPAFHGHAYNQTCQLSFHILMSPGFSLEDLETCEHVFSGSNAMAQLTHHATPFHFWQFIDMHFQQWDKDKHANLGKCFLMQSLPLTVDISMGEYLLNHDRQALDVLQEMLIQIAILLSGHPISNVQLARSQVPVSKVQTG